MALRVGKSLLIAGRARGLAGSCGPLSHDDGKAVQRHDRCVFGIQDSWRDDCQ
jgi:hypothetical protein